MKSNIQLKYSNYVAFSHIRGKVVNNSGLRLSIDRDSQYFKSTYSLRTECERYNSRFKNTGQERMWVRNQSSVTNLNTIAHICLLAVAIAAVTTQANHSYRKLKSIKRIA